MGNDLKNADTKPRSNFERFIDRRVADSPFRNVDNSRKSHVIRGVIDDRQIRHRVADFLTLVKALTADDTVRKTRPH